MQLNLFEPTQYDHENLCTVYDKTQFDWGSCFRNFVRFNYFTPKSFGVLADYREIFWELNRVCIANFVLDGLIYHDKKD